MTPAGQEHGDWRRLTAVILAGGKGTRLQPVLGGGQKVVADVAGRPFLRYVLDRLDEAGFRRAVLCTGYQAGEVRASLGDHHGALELSYVREPEPLGTAGALRNALPVLDDGPFVVLNGDSYCAVDWPAFVAAYRESSAAGAILLSEITDAAAYGTVDWDGAGRITAFREKGESGPGWINAGIYILERALIASIPEKNGAVSLERDCFPQWLEHERGLYAYRGEGAFLDIGVPERYAEAPAFMASQPDPRGGANHGH